MTSISHRRGTDFATYAWALLASRGDKLHAVELAKGIGARRVETILRSAANFGSTDDASWAGALAEHSEMVGDFVESIASASAFDRLLPSMRRTPMGVRCTVATATGEGVEVGEGNLKPAGTLQFDRESLPIRKAISLIAASAELFEVSPERGIELLLGELRRSVVTATDSILVSALSAGATGVPASGTGLMPSDFRDLLDSLESNGLARMFVLASQPTANALATDTAGDIRQHPQATPQGGFVYGVPMVVTDALTDDSSGARLLLVDAQQLAGDSGPITLASSKQATLRIGDETLHAWQRILVGVRAERWMTCAPLRPGAVAELSGLSFGS